MSIEAFGKKLKELRDRKGMTQTELGKKLKIKEKQIQRYERGELLPDYKKMITLKQLFEYDFYSLLSDQQGSPLAEINTNLKEIRGHTIAILTEQQAGQHMIFGSLERLLNKQEGELSEVADNLAIRLRQKLKDIQKGI